MIGRKYLVYCIYQKNQNHLVPPIIFSRKADALACCEDGDVVKLLEMTLKPYDGRARKQGTVKEFIVRKRRNGDVSYTIPTEHIKAE